MHLRLILLVVILALLAACTTPAGHAPSPGATPEAQALLPNRDAEISGQITQIDGERVLVEEQPGAQSGNKIWFTLNDATRILGRAGADLHDLTRSDLAVGQPVAAWAAGPLAESYPAQGSAAVILVLEPAATTTPAAGGAVPDRDPDVIGTITQQDGQRVLIEEQPNVMEGDKYWLTVTATTPVFADLNGTLHPRSAGDLAIGQRVAAWVEGAVAMSYPAQGAAGALVILAQPGVEATPAP
ncbi:DUF3221 domain-containing protein [Kallotenue papyrolyticum]|uniref:DUF3221 domain-containing protein n=1 Tax=Kallotenue papyrolyticum TaxID=1325125 RepID=UPI0004924807|nr:DUF3221 domain-containing protein [Kallotenue papyrolyticum]